MEESVHCPNCNSPYGYPTDGEVWMCPECSHEWNLKDAEEAGDVIG